MTEHLTNALEAARLRAGRDLDEDGHTLHLDDPVERIAVLLHRMGFETPDGALSMGTSPSGQVRLAKPWSRLSGAERQLHRRRAVAALEYGLTGRELRSRPEDNVA